MRQILRIPRLGTLAISEESALDMRHGDDRRFWSFVFWSVRLPFFAAGAAVVAWAAYRAAWL